MKTFFAVVILFSIQAHAQDINSMTGTFETAGSSIVQEKVDHLALGGTFDSTLNGRELAGGKEKRQRASSVTEITGTFE